MGQWIGLVKSSPETNPIFPWRSWGLPVQVFPYPLVNIQTTIENGHIEIVDLLIKNGDFP